MALLGVLTFALLGCSLRRMRSRDRLTVLVWWFASVCCVGSRPVGQLGARAVGADAAGGAAGAAIPAARARRAGRSSRPRSSRRCTSSRASTGPRCRAAPSTRRCSRAGWAAMFEIARRSLTWGIGGAGNHLRPAGAGGRPPRWWPPAAPPRCGWSSANAGATPATCCSACGCARPRWAAAHAAALILSLRALQLPRAGRRLDAAAATLALGAGTLMLVSGLSAVLVAVGLVASWLDTHAHARNRQLANSLNDANRRLRDQAHSDPLTRMPNRLMFEERMATALAAGRPRARAVRAGGDVHRPRRLQAGQRLVRPRRRRRRAARDRPPPAGDRAARGHRRPRRRRRVPADDGAPRPRGRRRRRSRSACWRRSTSR